MILYALVASDARFAVDRYPTREQAEKALLDALGDVPEWRTLLSVQPLEPVGFESLTRHPSAD